jgi:hypothetical protein
MSDPVKSVVFSVQKIEETGEVIVSVYNEYEFLTFDPNYPPQTIAIYSCDNATDFETKMIGLLAEYPDPAISDNVLRGYSNDFIKSINAYRYEKADEEHTSLNAYNNISDVGEFCSRPTNRIFVLKFYEKTNELKFVQITKAPPTIGGLRCSLSRFLLPQGCNLLRYIKVVGAHLHYNRQNPYAIQAWRGQSGAQYWRLRIGDSNVIKYGLPGRLASTFDSTSYGKILSTPLWIGDWYLALHYYGWFKPYEYDGTLTSIKTDVDLDWTFPMNR